MHKGRKNLKVASVQEKIKECNLKKLFICLKGWKFHLNNISVAGAKNQEDGKPIKTWNKVVRRNMCQTEE